MDFGGGMFICNDRDISGLLKHVAPGGNRFPVNRGRRGPGVLRLQPRRHIARSAIARAIRAEERSLHPAVMMEIPLEPVPDSDTDDTVEEQAEPVKTAKVLYLRRKASAIETIRNEPAKILSLAPYIGTRAPSPTPPAS